MLSYETEVQMKVADAVWVATALLHCENPDREDFSVAEIVSKAIEADKEEGYRPGLQIHASTHCVADKNPNPGRYRMLHETRRGFRRLFRDGDPYHEHREGGKIVPDESDLPRKYQPLLDWYGREYLKKGRRGR